MTDKLLNDLKQRLLQFFAKYPREQFKPQVIARRLSIKDQAEIHLLNQALNELFQSKVIDRGKRKRYGHAVPPATSRVTGILSITKQGVGIVRRSPPDEGTISIASKFLDTALDGDTVSVALLAHADDTLMEGEIVEIIQRSKQPIVGVFEKSKSFFFVVPDSRKITRDIYIAKGNTKGARTGQKVVAQIDAWESRNLNPEGHIVEVL